MQSSKKVQRNKKRRSSSVEITAIWFQHKKKTQTQFHICCLLTLLPAVAMDWAKFLTLTSLILQQLDFCSAMIEWEFDWLTLCFVQFVHLIRALMSVSFYFIMDFYVCLDLVLADVRIDSAEQIKWRNDFKTKQMKRREMTWIKYKNKKQIKNKTKKS